MSEPAPHDRAFPPDAFQPYVPAVIPPDPERDKRVAARRAADSARAGRALDRLLAPEPEVCGPLAGGGWRCRPWDCCKPADCLLPDGD